MVGIGGRGLVDGVDGVDGLVRGEVGGLVRGGVGGLGAVRWIGAGVGRR